MRNGRRKRHLLAERKGERVFLPVCVQPRRQGSERFRPNPEKVSRGDAKARSRKADAKCILSRSVKENGFSNPFASTSALSTRRETDWKVRSPVRKSFKKIRNTRWFRRRIDSAPSPTKFNPFFPVKVHGCPEILSVAPPSPSAPPQWPPSDPSSRNSPMPEASQRVAGG